VREHQVSAPDGARLHVSEQGTGRPVLLVQGLGYAGWAWRHQATAVAQVARAVVLDNRGTGRSDATPGPYSIDLLADDAAAVLDDRGAGPAAVVGASMGGFVAQRLAQRRPDLVDALVLVATTSGGPDAVGVPDETADAWRTHAAQLPDRFARATMPLSFAPGWPRPTRTCSSAGSRRAGHGRARHRRPGSALRQRGRAAQTAPARRAGHDERLRAPVLAGASARGQPAAGRGRRGLTASPEAQSAIAPDPVRDTSSPRWSISRASSRGSARAHR